MLILCPWWPSPTPLIVQPPRDRYARAARAVLFDGARTPSLAPGLLRYLEIINFVPQEFWVIDLQYQVPEEVLRAQGLVTEAPAPKGRAGPRKPPGEGAWTQVMCCGVCM
jgi:hypothetical protein